MIRSGACLLSLAILAIACSSGSSEGGAEGSPCPSVAGAWKVTTHCDASLVGQALTVTQTGCSLSFSSPFNAFTGSVAADGKLSVSGPQTCSGTAAPAAITMSCTPGTCNVTLSR